MGDHRRGFSREFKLEAVRLMTEGGLSVASVARDLGVRESVLGRWKKQLSEDPEEAFPGKGRLKSQDEELRILRRENEILRQERDILKGRGHFSAPRETRNLWLKPCSPGEPAFQVAKDESGWAQPWSREGMRFKGSQGTGCV